MESRALLSGFGLSIAPPDAAVQADFAKIQADQASCRPTSRRSPRPSRPTRQAIQAAITDSPTVQAAQADADRPTETAPRRPSRPTRRPSGRPRPRPPEGRRIAQYKADAAAAETLLKADATAIQTAIATDPRSRPPRPSSQTDAATITADETTLQADYTQLAKPTSRPSTAARGGLVHRT